MICSPDSPVVLEKSEPVINNINFFAFQFLYNHFYTGTFWSYAGSNRVNIPVIRYYSNF